ncbi:branched-chain amino acid ABC transporter substrate-binding protein [Pollutimonas nitritireducens]|uniref:Branched-chain amino acid ABC transporter substrate-binding protein n=1 Tax=Pollutimonas nitritireducens TaxID=2045209 RepID=A0A2N4UKI3_9BURK|nr:ABC transporter substrate-binding protein [Pollutimonas nitritireducens]PLC55536.1 branched-chain amino acid ABC transporter substrate-binding protein [Pollutimonas nitritireducens]
MTVIKRMFSAGLLSFAAWGASVHAADVTIGALFPLSGPNATYGDIFGSGANLAAEHINADKLIDGTLKIQYEDSQALPQQGVIGMNKLVNVSKVPYVLSAFTGVSKAISTTASRSKTVAINGGGVGPDLADLGPYFWNIIPLANFEVKAVLPYLIKERNLKRFVLVYVDDPLGEGIRKELTESLPQAGGELIEALSVPATAQQFSGIAARVRAANPDVIYIASYGSQQAQIVKQFRDNGIKQQFVSYTAFSIPEMSALPEAKGSLYTTQNVDWNSTDPVTKRFVDDFKKKHDKMPTAYIANYYNAVRLFGLLAHELQKKGKPITGENLLAQRIETKTFDLVGGKVTFADNGTVVSPMQVNEIDGAGGKVVSVVAE